MLPKVIFFDAVGTLFGVRGTVGEIYGQFVAQAGLTVDVVALNTAFMRSFKQAPRATFAEADPQNLLRLEFDWWKAVARHSFESVGILPQLPNFDDFFPPLFTYFETAAPWVLYPETLQTLQELQERGVELGVISNFDSRLKTVLQVLDLDRWFQSVTISTQVGVAKPETAIFTAALAKHSALPSQAWHVGDSWSEDYEGSSTAGLQGIWLNREAALLDNPQQRVQTPGTQEIKTLAPLCSMV